MQEGETSHHYVTISNASEALLFNNVFKDTMSAGASYRNIECISIYGIGNKEKYYIKPI